MEFSPRTTPGPRTDQDIPAYLESLGLPGLVDLHVHFLPDPMRRKVWAYFDAAEEHYGRAWPISYRLDEESLVELLRQFGLRVIPALSYPHKPGMAQWLNEWSADFAERIPGALHCATLYPEDGVGDYVAKAIADGAEVFKMHVQVGGFAPDDTLLDRAWEVLEFAGVPVVIHAGSAPLPGAHTGVEPVQRILQRHPSLTLVVAHLGMPEYHEFADLAEQYTNVHLDTTMCATDFTEEIAPLPDGYVERLAGLQRKVVLGSDFPQIPYAYAHQLEALARLDLGDEWMRAVLHDNGARLLGLPAPASESDAIG